MLVLGAGAGGDVLQALYHAASAVDAVELNPDVIRLVQQDFGAFSGRPYARRACRSTSAKRAASSPPTRNRYDLIQIALIDAFGASSAGLYALSESYLYTVESLQAYLGRLAPGGYLSITRWVALPPRGTLKLAGMTALALERSGVADPGRRLALIRSWNTATLLVKNGDFTADDIARLREFCRPRSFDLDWYPGIRPEEANRYNRLDQSWFHDGVAALLGPQRAEFIERYKFNIAPATDDRPYFFHFFRWRTLPELLRLKEQGGLPLLEWGYPLVVATLAQALAGQHCADPAAAVAAAPRRERAGSRTANVAARRGLLRGDRHRVHVRRDRLHPEVHPVPQPSAVLDRRGAVRFPAVCRAGQPDVRPVVHRGAGARAAGGVAGGSDRGPVARLRLAAARGAAGLRCLARRRHGSHCRRC